MQVYPGEDRFHRAASDPEQEPIGAGIQIEAEFVGEPARRKVVLAAAIDQGE